MLDIHRPVLMLDIHRLVSGSETYVVVERVSLCLKCIGSEA